MWEWMASYLCFVFQSFMVHGKKEIYFTTRDLLTRGIRNFTQFLPRSRTVRLKMALERTVT